MPTNQVRLNVYQIGNRVMDRDAPQAWSFPVSGVLLQDCSSSPARNLPTGYNVYGVVILPLPAAAESIGTRYYVGETLAQLVTLFNT